MSDNEQIETTEVVLVVADQMENLKTASEQAILNLHEDMNKLVSQATDLVINSETSEEEYKASKVLWRTIKDTHILVEKKRQELKAPMVQFGKKLDAFVKNIYDPLKNAENVVRDKMKIYENEIERIKTEKKQAKVKEDAEREKLETKLHNLNATLQRINECKTKEDIAVIQKELKEVDLKSFGDRSDEAGFITQNLGMTCTMMMNALPSAESLKPVVEEPVVEKAVEEKPVVKKVDKEEPAPIKMEEMPVVEEVRKTQSVGRLTRPEPKKVDLPKNGELDFGAVADAQSGVAPIEEEKLAVQYHSPEKVKELLGNSVLPMAVYEGTNEDNIESVMTVSSVSKHETNDEYDRHHGLPKRLEVMVEFANGFTAVASFEFTGQLAQFTAEERKNIDEAING